MAESDSDMSDDERPKGAKTQKKPTKQKGRAWLKEGQGDEPLNFLDPTVSQRVLGNGAFTLNFVVLKLLLCFIPGSVFPSLWSFRSG